jgi:hypothetical protein
MFGALTISPRIIAEQSISLDHNFKHRYHAHEHDELRYGGGN